MRLFGGLHTGIRYIRQMVDTTSSISSTGSSQIQSIQLAIKLSPQVTIHGDLTVPYNTNSVVVFAHGSGSSRHSPRNKYVARELQLAGIGTLLANLMTLEEERIDDVDAHLRFDIKFLSQRLNHMIDWCQRNVSEFQTLHNIGLFGASTGAASAIEVAAIRNDVKAVVSRGGRPDLATDEALGALRCPTLLLVGGRDGPVIDMNKTALQKMINVKEKELKIVPGATHLFPEPGALEIVAREACNWFKKYLK